MKFKRVLPIGDLHCGHCAGLTPPKYHSQLFGPRIYNLQQQLWNKYVEIVDSLKPIHAVIANGDLVDGKGKRSGGIEHMTVDRNLQAKMAVECLERCDANVYRIVRGTPYHVGVDEEWEDTIATMMGSTAGDHEWFDVNGVIFDCKHFVSGSSIPHGRSTPIQKDKLWNIIWSHEHEQQPNADVILRSHVHYHEFTGNPSFLGMTLPALQAAATKFGARKCSGVVHWGIVYFDVYEDGSYRWNNDNIIVVEPLQIKAEPL